jgi:hypothetical protein
VAIEKRWKITFVIIASALSITVLAGCNNSQASSSEDGTSTIATYAATGAPISEADQGAVSGSSQDQQTTSTEPSVGKAECNNDTFDWINNTGKPNEQVKKWVTSNEYPYTEYFTDEYPIGTYLIPVSEYADHVALGKKADLYKVTSVKNCEFHYGIPKSYVACFELTDNGRASLPYVNNKRPKTDTCKFYYADAYVADVQSMEASFENNDPSNLLVVTKWELAPTSMSEYLRADKQQDLQNCLARTFVTTSRYRMEDGKYIHSSTNQHFEDEEGFGN